MRTEQQLCHLGCFTTKIGLHKFVRLLQQIESLDQIGRITIYKCFIRFHNTSTGLERFGRYDYNWYVSSLV